MWSGTDFFMGRQMSGKSQLNVKDNKETIAFFLKGISLFEDLTEEELMTVVDYMNMFEFDAGQTLFEEGETGDYVCFVAAGGVDVVKRSVTGSNIVISSLNKGSVIGEMAIIDKTPRSATVVARQKTRLVVLGQNGFKLILQNAPRIGNKILIGIARRLSTNLRRTSNQLNAFNHLLVTISKQTGHKLPANVDELTTPESHDAIQEENEVETVPSGNSFFEKIKKNFMATSSRRLK